MISLEKFPKVELHLHLDGSIRVEDASLLLNKDLDDVKKNMIAPKRCQDLNEYLTKFSYPEQILQTEESLTLISYHLALDLVSDGVIYAEVRFAPLKHVFGGLSLEKVVESVLEGFRKVDIKINLILCMMRGGSFEKNCQVISLAKKYLNQGVCALDLAGAEALFKTKDYEELFSLARGEDIPFTIHAGEADGAESISSAIDFCATRIGHGIRLQEDKTLIEKVKNKGILLEMCPTSNIQTGVVSSYATHPIKTYFDEGILVSVNTDNRTVSNTTLTMEYEYLMQNSFFTIDDFIKMNQDAIGCSFLCDEEKRFILNKYNEKVKVYLENLHFEV